MRPRDLDLLFFTGFAFLLCRELDAVAQAEWHLLPFLSGMNDGDAYAAFVVLHIPLLALVLWWTGLRCWYGVCSSYALPRSTVTPVFSRSNRRAIS